MKTKDDLKQKQKEIEELFSPEKFICSVCGKEFVGDIAHATHERRCAEDKWKEESRQTLPGTPKPDKELVTALKGLLK